MPHPNRLKITVRILIFICLGCFIFSSCTPVSRNTIGDPSAEEAKSDVQVAPLSETPKAGNPSGDKKEFPPEKTPVKTSPPLGKTLSSTNGNLSKKICNSTNAQQSLNDNRAITEMQLSSEDKMDESSFSNGDEALDVTIGTDEDEDEKERDVMEDVLVLLDESHNHWIKGELDDALQMLDQAYAFLLDADGNPEIARQKDDLRLIIAKKILAIFNSIQTPAKGMRGEIPLISNDAVEKEIRSFQTIERDFFVTSYQRSMIYRPVISNELKRAGLPDELSWLPLVESGFKINALSPARALGLWQFIPSTGYKYGLNRDYWVDERMDIEKSTKAALAYLKDLHAMFGDWLTVLAGYNCGEGRVMKTISSQHINYLDRFWDLYQRLPNETARYVPRFIATLLIVKNPQKYGFDLESKQNQYVLPEYEIVETDRSMRLHDIAAKLETSEEHLHILSAELRHKITPDKSYKLKVPRGTGEKLLQVLADIPTAKIPRASYKTMPGAFITHRVRRGETLGSIAKKYGTSVNIICSANKLSRKKVLYVGQRLKVPYSKRTVSASEVSFYKIKRGDSLSTISNRYGIPIAKLKKINHLKSDMLQIGQVIRMRVGETSVEASFYKVKRGDSLSAISNKYGISVAKLKQINHLKSDTLQIGQVIRTKMGKPSVKYKVKKGDNLAKIARNKGISLRKLLTLNKMSLTDTIYPGQEIIIQ
jgi:membrane-bound lytic murein transglycosylase D